MTYSWKKKETSVVNSIEETHDSKNCKLNCRQESVFQRETDKCTAKTGPFRIRANLKGWLQKYSLAKVMILIESGDMAAYALWEYQSIKWFPCKYGDYQLILILIVDGSSPEWLVKTILEVCFNFCHSNADVKEDMSSFRASCSEMRGIMEVA